MYPAILVEVGRISVARNEQKTTMKNDFITVMSRKRNFYGKNIIMSVLK